MNNYLKKLSRQNRLKQLKKENKELKKMLQSQIEQYMDLTNKHENLRKKFVKIKEYCEKVKYWHKRGQDALQFFVENFNMQYGEEIRAEYKIIKLVKKVEKYIEKIDCNKKKYGVDI